MIHFLTSSSFPPLISAPRTVFSYFTFFFIFYFCCFNSFMFQLFLLSSFYLVYSHPAEHHRDKNTYIEICITRVCIDVFSVCVGTFTCVLHNYRLWYIRETGCIIRAKMFSSSLSMYKYCNSSSLLMMIYFLKSTSDKDLLHRKFVSPKHLFAICSDIACYL